jgi:hypothetical protein
MSTRPTDQSIVRPTPPARKLKTGRPFGAVQIPIIDANRRLVGWTGAAPRVENGVIRHATAERLVGGPIEGCYVKLLGADDGARAGAPSDWSGAWRCIALISEQAAAAMPKDGQAIDIPPSDTDE